MRVLAACEESQAVTIAFRELGHEAYSCDLLPCSGGHPEWHIQGDALELLKEPWDLVIAFPPCTYMTKAGAVRMFVNGQIVPERYELAMKAKQFFLAFLNVPCPKVAVENPTPMKIVGLPPCTQAIQPWMFGHPYLKRTCLWLKGLPPLMATDIVWENVVPYVNGGNNGRPGSRVGFARSPRVRSKTFPGIARAMAQQWGVE